MLKRLAFLLIVLFWITMNILLWRSEFGGSNEPGSTLAASLVWEKILTAPDDSALEIFWHGKRVGYCRWKPYITEEPIPENSSNEEEQPEGMVRRATEYEIDLEGNVIAEEGGGRVRFNVHATFSTNLHWKELSARATQRPMSFQVHALAENETVRISFEDDETTWDRALRWSELQQPEKLLRELGYPIPPGFFALPALGVKPGKIDIGLDWIARNDWLKIGHSRARVYRMQARLLEHVQIVVTVSRVGEILQVDLPGGLSLVNEALGSL